MAKIYFLSDKCEDKDELRNKGSNLITMTRIRLTVPPGFVVSIESYGMSKQFGTLPSEDIDQAISALKWQTKLRLGQGVSVRSSAPVSMPGVMDTLLNVSDREQVKQAGI